MAEYYVIRDKNTGLYFRGKGVNRWGKHYNQASIYRVKGSAEHTIKEISWRGEQAEIVPIQIIETSADVVPKSEVDKLKSDLVVWKQDRFNLYQRLECYEMARQKVAKEIFEDIDAMIFGTIIPNDCAIVSIAELAELKKKYTEEKNG